MQAAFDAGEARGMDKQFIDKRIEPPSFKEWIPVYRKKHAAYVTQEDLNRIKYNLPAKNAYTLKPLTMDVVMRAVSHLTGIPIPDLRITQHKHNHYSLARGIIYYLCYFHVPVEVSEIGARFGGRNHSNVVLRAQKFSGMLDIDRNAQRNLGIAYAILDGWGYHTECWLHDPRMKRSVKSMKETFKFKTNQI